MKEEIIQAIENIRQTGKYKVHDHICREMIYIVNQMDEFDPYVFRQELKKFRLQFRKWNVLSETTNAIKLCEWISSEVYRVQKKYNKSR